MVVRVAVRQRGSTETVKNRPAMMGIFATLDELLAALKAVQAGSFTVDTVYSPIPLHEIGEALGVKRSPVRFFTLTGGLLGIMIGVGLVIYTSLQWKFIVSGKPVIPLVPAVIVGFEFCVLVAIIFNLLGLLVNTRLPRLRLPDHHDPRFTRDRFGLLVLYAASERERLSSILVECGAEETHEATG
jgi:hypothetical protein